MKIIVGVDPGDTTGIAVFKDGEFSEGYEFKDIKHLAKLIRALHPEIIVAEQFYVMGAKARADRALKVLGGVELLQSDLGFELIYQSPSILSVWLPRTKGMNRSPHVRSACSHVMCYLRRQERIS